MTAALTLVVAALMVLAANAFAPLQSSSLVARRPAAVAARRALSVLRMSEGGEAQEQVGEASEAVAQFTEPEPDSEEKGEVSPKVGQQGFFMPNSNLRYGSSRDQDGKSNVWAIEPKMKVEDGENKGSALAVGGAILAVCAGLVAFTLANLPAADTY